MFVFYFVGLLICFLGCCTVVVAWIKIAVVYLVAFAVFRIAVRLFCFDLLIVWML